MARRYGRAPRGRRLRVGVPHGRWKTTTFVAGLRTSGVVAPFVLNGPINRAAFEAYVEKVLVPALRPGDVVILDNLSSHKGARVRALIEAAGASLLYLPPYSCLVPGFDGALFSLEWKDALWAKFFMGAPARRRQCVARSSIVKRA